MDKVFEVATKIKTPSMLAGVMFIAVFFLLRAIVVRNKLPTIIKALPQDGVMMIIKWSFLLIGFALVLGSVGSTIIELSRGQQLKTDAGSTPEESEDIEYRVKVSNDKVPLKGAYVSITGRKVNVQGYTNSVGFYETALKSSTKTIHLTVSAEGYETRDLDVTVTGRPFEEVKLTPIPSSSPQTSVTKSGSLTGANSPGFSFGASTTRKPKYHPTPSNNQDDPFKPINKRSPTPNP
jgi:hypothetical protein